jgi:hypothetical protein
MDASELMGAWERREGRWPLVRRVESVARLEAHPLVCAARPVGGNKKAAVPD